MFDSKSFLQNLTTKPGVYKMLNNAKKVIYVGKAKNLKKRVSSYFKNKLDPKTAVMVGQIAAIEVEVTPSEKDALILESNLIKSLKPKYNIVFRDDKSYPYIAVSIKDDYPRIAIHRGALDKNKKYFGPYPNGASSKDLLALLQRIFLVRNCSNINFKNRTRPCLQYQIKRCAAPCVGKITKEQYRAAIDYVMLFLAGKNTIVLQGIADKMAKASVQLDYEQAAVFRDQLQRLQKLQQSQSINSHCKINADVVALDNDGSTWCVYVLMVRNGQVLGGKTYFPKGGLSEDASSVLMSFISQIYGSMLSVAPNELVLPFTLPGLLLDGVAIKTLVRGVRAKWLQMAKINVQDVLSSRMLSAKNWQNKLLKIKELLGLEKMPSRIECFDISHTCGEDVVASVVVCDENGPNKKLYRHFNIVGIANDDYASMAQVLGRRYSRLLAEEAPMPDIVLIDGGRGQLTKAYEIFSQLGISGVILVGVAKGENRKEGLEKLWMVGAVEPIIASEDNEGLLAICKIRDEAHRFAIMTHRKKRSKNRKRSIMQDIPGIGTKRRQALLRHFGSWKAVCNADVTEIAKVPGISMEMAKIIAACNSGV